MAEVLTVNATVRSGCPLDEADRVAFAGPGVGTEVEIGVGIGAGIGTGYVTCGRCEQTLAIAALVAGPTRP